MSDRAYLPEFVRDALAVGEGSLTTPEGPAAGQPEAPPTSGPDAVSAPAVGETEVRAVERSLGSLLELAWPSDSSPGASVDASPVEAAPSAALFERLEATIGQPPYCYAPFFAKAAELFDLPEAAMVEQFARLREPKVWRFAGLPGIHHAAIQGGPKVQSAETLFVRFAPGVRFPHHRHTGLERVLVVEGHYRDSLGVVHHPGELRDWAEGTEHGFVVDAGQPCIFASVVFGRRFSAWPLRALSSLLRR